MHIFEDIYITVRHASSTRVQWRYVTTNINDVLEPNSFEGQCSVLKAILEHSTLFERFKFNGESTPKLGNVRIIYFDKTAKPCRSTVLVHYEQ